MALRHMGSGIPWLLNKNAVLRDFAAGLVADPVFRGGSTAAFAFRGASPGKMANEPFLKIVDPGAIWVPSVTC